MKYSRLKLLVGMTLACAMPAMAQDVDEQSDNVIYEAGVIEFVHTYPELRHVLSEAAPEGYEAVPVPRFAIKSKNNNFVLAIGGEISGIFGYDIGNNLYEAVGSSADFITSKIPVPSVAGHRGDMFINPFQSHIDFTVVGLAGQKNQITGYIKLKPGNGNLISLNRAYIKWRGLTVGENATLFQDSKACQPPTIDPQGPSGKVSHTSYQLTYTSPSYSGFSYAVGLELPTFYSSNGYYFGKDYTHEFYEQRVTADASKLVPDIPVWVEYGADSNNRVRLSGLLRDFMYRDLLTNETHHTLGWGASLSGNFSFYKPLVFNFQAVYGQGIGAYIQDIGGTKLSFTPNEEHIGKMSATPMMGLVLGASYNPTDRLQFNAVGSYARVFDVAKYAGAASKAGVSDYHYGTYVAVNGFYNITKYLQLGVEYVYGHRGTYALGGASDHRVQAELAFQF